MASDPSLANHVFRDQFIANAQEILVLSDFPFEVRQSFAFHRATNSVMPCLRD